MEDIPRKNLEIYSYEYLRGVRKRYSYAPPLRGGARNNYLFPTPHSCKRNTLNCNVMKKLNFRNLPMCEILHDKPANHFTWRRGQWFFVSTEAPEDFNEYHFEIADFFKTPAATIDWLAHLHEKSWFDPNDFCAMMHRFRKETDSFGALSVKN